MAKIFPTPASKIISRIKSNQNKQIYLTNEKWSNMKKNSSEIPEKYRFLASSDGYVIDGHPCLRLECIICYRDNVEESFYYFPNEGEEFLL